MAQSIAGAFTKAGHLYKQTRIPPRLAPMPRSR